MQFKNWLIEMSSLRNSLIGVPQDPIHHPEGRVFHHTYMVRNSLPHAINLLKDEKAKNPDGPLSNLNLNLSDKDMNLLKIAAWMHDIGKITATEPHPTKPGRYTAHAHDEPEHYLPNMEKLGQIWKNMKEKNPDDFEDLKFIIDNHMQLKDGKGIQKRKLEREMLHDGKYKDERKYKLLLLIWLMDGIGRGKVEKQNRLGRKEFVGKNLDAGSDRIKDLYISAARKPKIEKPQSAPSPDNPKDFADALRGKPEHVIRMALKGKFKGITDEEIDKLFV